MISIINYSSIIFILALLMGCSIEPKTQNTESIERLSISYFPEKASVLSEEYQSSENLFPFATVKIKLNGEEKEIPVVFAYFNPDRNNPNDFPDHDDIDNYSFDFDENGLLVPNFDTAAFEISEDHLEYFNQSLDKYSKKKAKSNGYFINLDREKPGWWQGDETPTSKNGSKSLFICQSPMSGAVNGDGMMYVFYDVENDQIDIVIQRD